jgi:NADPH-dependent ferric siderophore reductase
MYFHITETPVPITTSHREERHFDKHWVKAAGYWQRDAVGVHEVFGDD